MTRIVDAPACPICGVGLPFLERTGDTREMLTFDGPQIVLVEGHGMTEGADRVVYVHLHHGRGDCKFGLTQEEARQLAAMLLNASDDRA